MKRCSDGYEYPTVDDNSAFDRFLPGDRGKLASFRKGLRWALLSSSKIWEPEHVSSFPGLDASDAKWVRGLHGHQ
eukprot:16447197-Heterocapsa_arctica.AAC.1